MKEIVQQIKAIAVPSEDEIDQQLAELTDVRSETTALKEGIKECTRTLSALKSLMLRRLNGETPSEELPVANESVIADISATADRLDDEINSLDEKTKDNSALSALQEKHRELLDRKNCASNLPMFMERRLDLCALTALKKCKGQCETGPISRRGSSLREKYLTEDFRNKINSEVKFLGLTYLPIVVDGHTERGVGYIGVALSKSGREPTSSILSEGEFRGLALACFFAEIGMIDRHDGIIVDDPVSSLDHLHIEQVAKRLIEEAKTRPQVIVFTHDLSFYYDLLVAASQAQIPIHCNWIYKSAANGCGTISVGDGPWQAKKVKERIAFLDRMIAEFPDSTACPPEAQQENMESFYTRLRETWERLVEECLLNGVVGRFQPGVATQSLKGVNVTDEDYSKIFFAMKKASEYSGHDRAAGRQPRTRDKNEMRTDLDEIRAYEKELRKRVTDLEKARRTLEGPPSATITLPSKP